jgi:nucleoside-diphosphate-sugar epimerase
MKDLLITGGLGQAGMAIAEAAQQRGWTITLVGRSPLHHKAKVIQDWVRSAAFTYQALDIFAPGNASPLQDLAVQHRYWIQAAESYQIGHPNKPAHAHHLLDIAVQAGYTVPGNRRLLRIGSPLAEIYHDHAFRRRFPHPVHNPHQPPAALPSPDIPSSFPEDHPIDGWYRFHPAFATHYFKTKRRFARAAQSAITQKGLACITICPTALFGPYGTRDAAYDGLLHVIRGDFPYRHYLPTNPVNALPVRHFAAAALDILTKGKIGHTYQVTGANLRASELMEMALRAVGKPIPKLRWKAGPSFLAFPLLGLMSLPYRLLGKPKPWWMQADLFAALVMMRNRSSQKAMNEFGYTPPGKQDLETAITEALDWYLQLRLGPD